MIQPYICIPPSNDPLPLIFDSPHSSRFLPQDMKAIAGQAILDSGCDCYVDELWHHVTKYGSHLLLAGVHRAYIDFNRSQSDIDPYLLIGDWADTINPTEKSKAGMGLIRSLALPGIPVYDRKLTMTEVQSRIANYYRPYHKKLAMLIENNYQFYGQSWHINCHSMKATGNAMNDDNGSQRADFVLGDRFSSSCNPDFTAWLFAEIKELGYKVKINDPYSGAELVRAYSNPNIGKHSIQIEINRGLYMNEQDLSHSDGFAMLKNNLEILTSRVMDYVKEKLR